MRKVASSWGDTFWRTGILLVVADSCGCHQSDIVFESHPFRPFRRFSSLAQLREFWGFYWSFSLRIFAGGALALRLVFAGVFEFLSTS